MESKSVMDLVKPIFGKNWLVHKIVKDNLMPCIEEYFSGTLLDIGCGDKPYERLVEPYLEKYIGLDHEHTLHDMHKADLIGSAYNIPLDSESIDTILCTAVLEHLERPDKALKEAYRVLREGGYAIYTIPLFWHLHEEPRDFYRYTNYGIDFLFRNVGFELVKLQPLSGFCVTFGQELIYYLWRFRKGGMLNPLWWLVPIAGMIIQAICYFANKLDYTKEFSWMYLVVARKQPGR